MLIDIFYQPIYQYLRRFCGNRQDAEDLTQDTFVKVWSSLESYNSRFKFTTWIYTIAYRVYIDWQLKNSRNTICHNNRWWQDNESGTFTNVVERQIAQRLYEAVDQLGEDKKHVVYLHYYQGLSITETAKVLNIATSTVKYRLREVFKILREKLNFEEKEK